MMERMQEAVENLVGFLVDNRDEVSLWIVCAVMLAALPLLKACH